MKTLKSILLAAGVILTSLTFNSCMNDDGYSLDKYWIEPATVVPLSNNSFYLRTDDGSTLWPAAPVYIHYDAKARQRAWVNFTILGDSISGYTYGVKINGIKDILTKDIAPNLGEENDKKYGKDPVNISNPKEDLWIADNFLNIIFGALYGGVEKHFVNVIQPDPNDPYTLEFRHNAYNDPKTAYQSGLVCFRLDNLPDTDGKTVTLKLRVKTEQGDKEYTMEYNSKNQVSTPKGKSLKMEENNNIN